MTVHDDCREALLDDEPTEAAHRHLRRCGACRSFADRLTRVTVAAPLLAPRPAPESLVDDVLARVRDAAAPTDQRPRRARVPLWPSVLTTAAAAVLATALAALPPDDSPREVLLAAATATEQAGTGRLEVRGEAELTAEAQPGRPPDRAAFPVGTQDYALAQWELAVQRFEQQLDAFLRGTETGLDDALDGLDRQLDGMLGGPPGAAPPQEPAAPDEPPAGPAGPTRPAPPSGLTLRVEVAGAGQVRFDDALRVAGQVRAAAADAAPVAAPFELAATGDAAVVRAGDGWAQVADASAALGDLLLRSDAALRLLRGATGEVDELAGDRYRFEVPASVLGLEGGGRYTAEATLDDDGRLARLSVSGQGSAEASGLTWRTRTEVALSDLGAPGLAPTVPAAETQRPAPEGSSRLVHPFGPSLAAATGSRR